MWQYCWIRVDLDRIHWRSAVNTVMNFRVSSEGVEDVFTSLETISVPGRADPKSWLKSLRHFRFSEQTEDVFCAFKNWNTMKPATAKS
jgi:hypothetical protein